MNQGLILSIVNQAMYEILVLSVPLLGAAMVVGLVISIFQATTSIQEQTLTFVPKIVIVIIILMVAGPFFMNSMIDFTKNLFNLMATAKL
ncbi:MAG: flagellar biosynthesis protein FliQ [Brevinematales bacterium]|jgi:flagellar biosynthetic protein FliQ